MSQQVNLYNPAFEERKKLFGAAAMAQALSVLSAGVVALALYGNGRVAALEQQADAGAAQLEKKKAQLAAVSTEFAPREKSPELESRLAQAEAQLASFKRVAAVLERGELGNTSGYSEYFRALARQHVDGLWLTGLAITGAGCDVGVHGRALDPSLLPGFLARLTQERIMRGKSFGSLQLAQPERKAAKAGEQGEATAPFVEFSLQSISEGARS
jgi:hypothetical protein